MQSCLEKVSMDARHTQESKSDYQRNNQYSATHPDALASSGNGKGTGHGGHTHWLPNCRGTIGLINYSNFDTAISSGAGNDCDNAARDKSLARSLYNDTNEYSLRLVNTSRNVNEGQFVNTYKPKTKRICY
jgi:hypothetical protein